MTHVSRGCVAQCVSDADLDSEADSSLMVKEVRRYKKKDVYAALASICILYLYGQRVEY